jgi:hypothetical protein
MDRLPVPDGAGHAAARAARATRRALLVALLVTSATGCDFSGFGDAFGGLGCAIASSFDGLVNALGRLAGAAEPHALSDDDGRATDAIQGLCQEQACDNRNALAGAELGLLVNLTQLARERGVAGDEDTLSFASSHSGRLGVQEVERGVDGCEGEQAAAVRATFLAPGRAAIVVRAGERELSRFTFSIYEAARLRLTAAAAGQDARIDGEPGAQTLRATPQAQVGLEVAVLNADGEPLLGADGARIWIEDERVGLLLRGLLPRSAVTRSRTTLITLAPGSTRVRAVLANRSAELPLEVVETLPGQGVAGGQAPVPEDADMDGGVADGSDSNVMHPATRDADDDAGVAIEETTP